MKKTAFAAFFAMQTSKHMFLKPISRKYCTHLAWLFSKHALVPTILVNGLTRFQPFHVSCKTVCLMNVSSDRSDITLPTSVQHLQRYVVFLYVFKCKRKWRIF